MSITQVNLNKNLSYKNQDQSNISKISLQDKFS